MGHFWGVTRFSWVSSMYKEVYILLNLFVFPVNLSFIITDRGGWCQPRTWKGRGKLFFLPDAHFLWNWSPGVVVTLSVPGVYKLKWIGSKSLFLKHYTLLFGHNPIRPSFDKIWLSPLSNCWFSIYVRFHYQTALSSYFSQRYFLALVCWWHSYDSRVNADIFLPCP